MLDGALARIKGTSGAWGAFLDSTLDRVADAAVFAGLTLWFVRGGHDRLLAGVALFCLVSGALVSYAKARAEGLGLRCDVGIAERTERLLIALLAAGLSGLGVPYVLADRAVGAGRAERDDVRAAGARRARAGRGRGERARTGRKWRMTGCRTERWPAAGVRPRLGCRLPGARVLGPRRRSCSPPTSPGAGRGRGCRCWRGTCAGSRARGDRRGAAGPVPGGDALLRPLLDGGVPAAGDQRRADPRRHRLHRRRSRRRSRYLAAGPRRDLRAAAHGELGRRPAPGSSPAGRPAFTTVAERLKPESVYDRFVAFRESLGLEVLPASGGMQQVRRCWPSGCGPAGWSACLPTGTSPAPGSRWSSSARRRG